MTAKPKPLIPSTSTLGLGLRPNTVYGVTGFYPLLSDFICVQFMPLFCIKTFWRTQIKADARG